MLNTNPLLVVGFANILPNVLWGFGVVAVLRFFKNFAQLSFEEQKFFILILSILFFHGSYHLVLKWYLKHLLSNVTKMLLLLLKVDNSE